MKIRPKVGAKVLIDDNATMVTARAKGRVGTVIGDSPLQDDSVLVDLGPDSGIESGWDPSTAQAVMIEDLSPIAGGEGE